MKYNQLEVYKKAFTLALEIHTLAEVWPQKEQMRGLADQIRRASKGICANIAEGLGRTGDAEQKRFLNMAAGSASEVEVWLEFAVALKYISPEDGKRMAEAY
ncbi:MAG: four helix bundle protein [Proteobacteria bacterium]|nr:four helix bundle protein [Pseudomonadota bacterium]